MTQPETQPPPTGSTRPRFDDGEIVKVTAGDGAYPSRRTVVYIRNHPAPGVQWRGTDGSYMRDDQIRTFVDEGRATVLDPGTR